MPRPCHTQGSSAADTFTKHWCLEQKGQEGGRPSAPNPTRIPMVGWWLMAVVEARALTLLILSLPTPPAPVPHGSQGDDMAHNYQGGKQAARRLHGCHKEQAELPLWIRDWLLQSQTAPPSVESEQGCPRD